MFEEIIASKEVKFNDLEKKVFKFVCFFGCLIIKLMLEVYDRKLMENRDKKKYRHKGLRQTSVNTIMGEIKYKRVMYEVQEEGITKTVYLLDETLKISAEGKASSNLVEKVIETVPVTDSYRKAEEVIDTTTNTSLSHEKIRNIIVKIGDKITNKEKKERKLFDKNQLVAGLKEVTALFEEADGIWINLQGKDRKEKWSDLWYIFKPFGYDKTLAQMSEEERKSRVKYEDIDAMREFAKWYKKENYINI